MTEGKLGSCAARCTFISILSLLSALLGACSAPDDLGATSSRVLPLQARAEVPAAAAGDGAAGRDAGALVPTRRERLDALMQPLLDDEWLTGAAIALIDRGQVETYGYGATRHGGEAPDGRTLFEIGSVTKTLTSLLLAELVHSGSVQLEQSVASLLPATVNVPDFDGRAITLLDLATHTSGLPRLPTNLLPEEPSEEQRLDPYAEYELGDLYEFLSGYTLGVEPGTVFEYSNLGVALLGHALSLAAGASYERAVCERITGPLGMHDTTIALNPEQAARFADGYDADLAAVPAWSFGDATEAAGALRSSAEDLARYVAAELAAGRSASENPGERLSPLAESMVFTQVPRRPTDGFETIGLGWFIQRNDVFFHDGGTGGHSSMVFFDRALDVGAVILVNTSTSVTNALSTPLYALLAGGTPEPLSLPPFVRLPHEVLDRYTGTYDFGAPAVVQRDGSRLFLELGDSRFGLYADGPASFNARSIALSARFETGATELDDTITLSLDGESYTAPRLGAMANGSVPPARTLAPMPAVP